MSRFLAFFMCIFLVGFIAGCGGPEHPDESAVKSKITGDFCSKDNKVKLKLNMDGTYSVKKVQKSVFSTGVINENCSGTYTLEYDDSQYIWNLVYAKSSENSNPFVSCSELKVPVWQHEKGYLVGDAEIKLKEPMSQSEVTNKCEF